MNERWIQEMVANALGVPAGEVGVVMGRNGVIIMTGGSAPSSDVQADILVAVNAKMRSMNHQQPMWVGYLPCGGWAHS